MNKEVCQKFENVWGAFPDKLDKDKYYKFENNNILNSYCDNDQCEDDIKKISAGFFYLLSGFFGDPNSFNFDEKSNNDIFYYIMIWLSYMLNLKKNDLNNSLQYFYDIDISNQNKYKNPIVGFTEYNNYIDLLDKKKIVNMDIKDISKFYAPFKSLCTMYNEFNDRTSDCKNCSNNAKEFVNKYNELNEDHSITGNVSYSQILCTLSTDYNNLKSKCSNSSSFPEIKTPTNCVKRFKQSSQLISAQNSEDISSSSIGNKLFTVLSIFGAIAFLLGISYKYSLFGFRKRFQKQKLREKIKNIKKKMNR
ncbi:PIR protein [Plasmodium yoelii]|uniref:PIR protein n=2 Tax=Plasmodium yoelii TaxID=5861 RepID=A0AAE9WNJ7_PLAYO|nr:PIR protein [Plasmodium yoelii]XP_034493593.1 PIR protein [Plasmodium yoelii]WBY56166.1 PIR protein [Plasmodium yoelii yoelii]WBY59601.1 PIR protein [Plasmodium yoelii yoelii]CDS44340.1 YIR protein [Plasmodium yoelii]VTZ75632.1 PIR protein [Plasmodium yoelii]VTZ80343.1 PIR protein [Plasmodium yoelii]|eukprot:XP_022811002.1 PIR protein [Plasmodium yoelii]